MSLPTSRSLDGLPPTSDAMMDVSWTDLERWYRELETVPVAANPGAWLAAWSRLESLLTEAASRAMIAYTCDTTDRAKEARHLRFSTDLIPRAEKYAVALARRLLESGVTWPDLDYALARFRATIAVFREENIPLFSALEELAAQYQRITGGLTAEWEGKQVPIPRLAPFLQVPDRAVRERAWRASVEPYAHHRDELAALFTAMRTHRQEVAANAGFASFREYIFPAKARFDYGPDECLAFHRAVEVAVVPVIERLHAIRRRRLGVESLRPWDLAVNPYWDRPIVPYTRPDDFPRIAARIFHRLDPDLGAVFDRLRVEGMLDLESRQGKAPGGYCDTLQAQGRPFIFMNASGVMQDVNTLLHEAGHAFHALAAAAQPLLWQRQPGAEAAELASMSMELLAGSHLGPPDGYLTADEARVAALTHLEEGILTLAHVASVDAFQHWLYTDPAARDPEARDRAWLAIRARFDPAVDWSGLAREQITRWYRQLHIFLYPFYYIEYAFAQLGAFQVWRNSLVDAPAAIRRYRAFLARGSTLPLPDLYQEAGIRFAFDEATLRELMSFLETELDRMRAALPAG